MVPTLHKLAVPTGLRLLVQQRDAVVHLHHGLRLRRKFNFLTFKHHPFHTLRFLDVVHVELRILSRGF